MDAEHDLMADALEKTSHAMTAVKDDPDDSRRDRALGAVRRLREVTFTHLEHEQRELAPLLLGPFKDSDQAADKTKRLRAGSPQRAGTMMLWLADGAGPAETEALHDFLPAPARLLLITVLGRSYRRGRRRLALTTSRLRWGQAPLPMTVTGTLPRVALE